MTVDVTECLKNPGETFLLEVEFPLPDISYNGCSYQVVDLVSIVGKYVYLDERITLDARLKAKVKSECVKCLEDAFYDIDAEFKERISKTNPDDFKIVNNNVDLSEIAEENIIFNLPERMLCKEDCKGICPNCGANLNKKTCDCNKEGKTQENAFEALKDLFS